MKKLRIRNFSFVILSVLFVFCACFMGCAKQDEATTESPAVEEVVESTEPKEIPEKYFLTKSSQDSLRYAITSLEGESVELADDTWEPLGPFANGYVVVQWETSEYDEEWKTEHDKVTHYGLVDKTGNMACDLTGLFSDFRESIDIPNNSSMSFADGRLVVYGENSGVNHGLVSIGENGEVVYSLGQEGCTISFDLLDERGNYRDGVLGVSGPLSLSMIVDESGEVLASSTENGEEVRSLGKGYVCRGFDQRVVTDYEGKTLFDVSTVNISGDIEDALIVGPQPETGGIVNVTAQKINPYGGQNKKLEGVYSVSASKWIVPLSEGLCGYVNANDGLVPVVVDAKEFLTVGYGANDDDANEAYSCLMDYEGNIVLDQDSEIIAQTAADAQMRSYSFSPEYLQDHFWLVARGNNKSLVAQIVDGEVLGVYPINFSIQGTYPNNDYV